MLRGILEKEIGLVSEEAFRYACSKVLEYYHEHCEGKLEPMFSKNYIYLLEIEVKNYRDDYERQPNKMSA